MDSSLVISKFFMSFLFFAIIFPFFYKKKPSGSTLSLLLIGYVISQLLIFWGVKWQTNALGILNEIISFKVSGAEKYTAYFTILAAFTEEILKFVGVFLLMHISIKKVNVRGKTFFLPKLGKLGIIAPIIIGGIFASLENYIYVRGMNYDRMLSTIMDRIIAGTLFIHIVSVYINYYFILNNKKFIPIGILLSVLYHALFNYILIMVLVGNTQEWWAWMYAWISFGLIVFYPNGGKETLSGLYDKMRKNSK